MDNEDTRDQEQNSVTGWFSDLQAGDAEAVARLWDRYFHALVSNARKRMGESPRQASDEEDVALSVFDSLCRGAEAGRFTDIQNRDDLWWLLLSMTRRKVIDQWRRDNAQKRGGGPDPAPAPAPPPDDSDFDFKELISDEPDAEYLTALKDQFERLLVLLPSETLRKIANWRVEGWTVKEIAIELKVGKRAIERKLELIRETWTKAFES